MLKLFAKRKLELIIKYIEVSTLYTMVYIQSVCNHIR